MSSGLERIYHACSCNDAGEVQRLLSSGTVSVDGHDNRGWFPLHMAARAGSWQCLQVVLDVMVASADTLSIDIDTRTYCGKTALYLACENKHMECARLLMANHADPTLSTLQGRSPLHAALDVFQSNCDDVQLTNELLEYGASQLETMGGRDSLCSFIEQQDPCSPLLIEAISSHHTIEMITKLIRSGASTSLADDAGRTPLVQAVKSRRNDVVHLLRDLGKLTPQVVNARDIDGKGVLAAMGGRLSTDVLDCLLEHGLEVNREDVKFCMNCARYITDYDSPTATLELLLSEPFKSAAEECKEELALIASNGYLYMLEFLLYRDLFDDLRDSSAEYADFFRSRLNSVQSHHDLVFLVRILFISCSAGKRYCYRRDQITDSFSDVVHLGLNTGTCFLRRFWAVLVLMHRFSHPIFEVDFCPVNLFQIQHVARSLICVFSLTHSLMALPSDFTARLMKMTKSSPVIECLQRYVYIAHMACLLHPHRIDLWSELLDDERFSSIHSVLRHPASLVSQCRYTIVHALETSAKVNQSQQCSKRLYCLVQQLSQFVPTRILSILLNGPQEVISLLNDMFTVSRDSVWCQYVLQGEDEEFCPDFNIRRIGAPRFLECEYQPVVRFFRHVDKLEDIDALVDFAESLAPSQL